MAFFKLNTKVKSLNDDILVLKDQYELLTEEQRLNTQKINELFDMFDLKFAKEVVKEVALDSEENDKKAYQIYTDGKNQFVAGEYDKAVVLFRKYLVKNLMEKSILKLMKLLVKMRLYLIL